MGLSTPAHSGGASFAAVALPSHVQPLQWGRELLQAAGSRVQAVRQSLRAFTRQLLADPISGGIVAMHASAIALVVLIAAALLIVFQQVSIPLYPGFCLGKFLCALAKSSEPVTTKGFERTEAGICAGAQTTTL